jgi:hypothetical protein
MESLMKAMMAQVGIKFRSGASLVPLRAAFKPAGLESGIHFLSASD